MAAYLIDALKRDYQAGQSSHQFYFAQRDESERQALQKSLDEDQVRREKDAKTRQLVDAYFHRMTASEREQLLLRFEKHIQSQDHFYLYKKYQEQGLKSPAVRAVFNIYVSALIRESTN